MMTPVDFSRPLKQKEERSGISTKNISSAPDPVNIHNLFPGYDSLDLVAEGLDIFPAAFLPVDQGYHLHYFKSCFFGLIDGLDRRFPCGYDVIDNNNVVS